MPDIAASGPASTGSSAPASATPTDATVQSGTGANVSSGAESQAPGQSSGEPPRERWDSILSNARTKAQQEEAARWQQRFEPYADFERDPWSAVQRWLEQAEKHSLYGPVVKQHYESRFKPQTQEQPEPQPDVPIVDANGYVTGKTYSADRLKEWHRWNDVQTQAKLDARFSPIEQREKERQQQEQEQQMWHQATRSANSTLSELRQLPYFKEHEPAIRQALFEHKEWGSNIHQAFNHVMMTQILPTLGRAEQKAVLDTLTSHGAANTVAPGSTTVGTPKFKSFGAAAEYYAAHPDEANAMANKR